MPFLKAQTAPCFRRLHRYRYTQHFPAFTSQNFYLHIEALKPFSSWVDATCPSHADSTSSCLEKKGSNFLWRRSRLRGVGGSGPKIDFPLRCGQSERICNFLLLAWSDICCNSSTGMPANGFPIFRSTAQHACARCRLTHLTATLTLSIRPSIPGQI